MATRGRAALRMGATLADPAFHRIAWVVARRVLPSGA
jgi:hypothetical protein